MSTTLSIRSIELWTKIGVSAEERSSEQRVLLTLEITLEEEAGKSDRLEDTLDYALLTTQMQELAKKEHRTMERLTAEVVEAVLASPKVRKVTVTLEKRALPGIHSACITIIRP